jgi:hypothetical protein
MKTFRSKVGCCRGVLSEIPSPECHLPFDFSNDFGMYGSPSGTNSVVECNLAKVEVASSNLVSRSKFDNNDARVAPGRFRL